MIMSIKASNRLGQELENLLAEPLETFLDMECNRYDELAGPLSKSLVLFGAGGLGRKTLVGLRTIGIEPIAFADSNPNAQGQSVDGVKVLSPKQAADEFGKTALFVITVYTDSAPGGIEPIKEKLGMLGCEKVISFAPLYWKYPGLFLPHYAYDLPHKVIEAANTVKAAASLFGDPISQEEYLGQIHWRLNPQFAPITARATHEIYFPPDLFTLNGDEVFVDCGAFTGDTIQSFLHQCGGKFEKLLAYEPDPASYQKLTKLVNSLPRHIATRIQTKELGVGSRSEQLHFNAQGVASSSRSDIGEIVIQSEPLDSLLAGESPTYIKMDIEGAEMEALKGAVKTICNHLPLLAISVYHCQDHIWSIPSLLHTLSESYRFYLRRYSARVLDDLVLYAIPDSR